MAKGSSAGLLAVSIIMITFTGGTTAAQTERSHFLSRHHHFGTGLVVLCLLLLPISGLVVD